MMTLDPNMLIAIGAVWTALTGGVGWLIAKLWQDRNDLQTKVFEILHLQYGDAMARKELWDKLTASVIDQTRNIEEFRKVVTEMREDLRRMIKV
jgi:hypothetical protein